MSGLTLKGVSNFEVRRPNFRPNRFGARGHLTPNCLIDPFGLAARSVHTNTRAQCDENIISAIHFVYLAEITGLLWQRGMC